MAQAEKLGEATASRLATLLGISQRAVLAARDVIKRGMSRGCYLLIASIQSYFTHLRNLAQGMGGEAAIAEAATERAKLAKAQAELAAAKAERMKGEVVPVDEVKRECTGRLRALRARSPRSRRLAALKALLLTDARVVVPQLPYRNRNGEETNLAAPVAALRQLVEQHVERSKPRRCVRVISKAGASDDEIAELKAAAADDVGLDPAQVTSWIERVMVTPAPCVEPPSPLRGGPHAPDPVLGVQRERPEKPFERDPAAIVVEPTPRARTEPVERPMALDYMDEGWR